MLIQTLLYYVSTNFELGDTTAFLWKNKLLLFVHIISYITHAQINITTKYYAFDGLYIIGILA